MKQPPNTDSMAEIVDKQIEIFYDAMVKRAKDYLAKFNDMEEREADYFATDMVSFARAELSRQSAALKIAEDLRQAALTLIDNSMAIQNADFDRLHIATIAKQAADVKVLRKALTEIHRYLYGHKEPGHECVQCLIAELAREALSRWRNE